MVLAPGGLGAGGNLAGVGARGSAPTDRPRIGEELFPFADFRLVAYPPRSVVFTQGDPADRLYLIADGSVRLCYLDELGEEHMIGVLGAGHFVGDAGAIRGTVYGVSAVTQEASRLYVIPVTELPRLLQHPQAGWLLLESLAQKVCALTHRLYALTFHAAQVAVAQLLLDLMAYQDLPQAEGFPALRLSHREIACATGLSRPTVAKALRALAARDLIALSRSRILVKDLEGLRHMVETSAV
ncbi:MAG: Crp/Fnr family transcriptional regulator [Armatimonadota bacterium]|nr:Crp/Fnr family transcriptional regulator [Armatimonadota bacterium]MDR7443193.1 Crp/Fnr family transcriptional regulator [Armatimonadota bacterium]MDR7614591.1 Crp/Fnr family transcriptional regulator [Armatimonadota bacterium]